MSAQPHVLTARGRDRLRAELHHFTSVRRPEVAQQLRDAKALGELSENPEYDDAKREQAFVEGRIHEIKEILASARVIEDEEAPIGEVAVGSVVEVQVTGMPAPVEWTVVGWVEADPAAGLISNESPVGAALIGHRPGDRVEVQTPAGHRIFEILSVRRMGDPESAKVSDAKPAKPSRQKAKAAARRGKKGAKPRSRKPAASSKSRASKKVAAAKTKKTGAASKSGKKRPAAVK